MTYQPGLFAEKVLLAQQTARQQQPSGGLYGLEMEWNLLDEQFRPLLTVGAGPAQQSFVDYLRAECLPPALRQFSQLEVFQWMIEWATRPYYSARQAVYEARLMEAALINALDRAGRSFDRRLYYWHGNLPNLTDIHPGVIPASWPIAKRRYLERCVELYGEGLATAGTHANLSLPDPLFAWDFMHLPQTERRSRHLDDFKSEFYITATRILRAYAALFVAASASTPLQSRRGEHGPEVHLSDFDSVRSLTFPNPLALDAPHLYRSYDDYLHISYDLVRSGLRFGNNNWTPVRARSFAEPVERLIAVTSEQLGELYARGLYVVGGQSGDQSAEEMARQIEMQNLMARINLPMSRVEVRTDDGGHTLDEDVALLALKHLLLLRAYGDPAFGRAFRYDAEDIARARRNEDQAARQGLRAEIEHPFSGKPIAMRAFLRQALDEVLPLAEVLGQAADLQPLLAMASGAPNAAERMRQSLRCELCETPRIPVDLLAALARQREAQVAADVERICNELTTDSDARLAQFLSMAGEAARQEIQTPIHFHTQTAPIQSYPDKTSEIVALAEALIRIPSVTACPQERLDEVRRAGLFIYDYLKAAGAAVQFFEQGKYPALLAGFPGELYKAPVMLSGHFDVVPPEPDDAQFEPHIEGDYLWGRGAADMKTVVATYLVWLKDALRHGPPYPALNLLLIGNEENGESEAFGTPHVLSWLEQQHEYRPALFIAGERTGERGDELYGEICTENRGVMRADIWAYGQRGHSGVAGALGADLSERLLAARAGLGQLLKERLTLNQPDGWQSQFSFPFLQVGEPGIYNVTPAQAVLGLEIRSIPQDDLQKIQAALGDYCAQNGLDFKAGVCENGVACSPHNPHLQRLAAVVERLSGSPARLGRKLPGTSARFAPGGQAVVWGQSGLGPHSKAERHYIPSIEPYYRCLEALARS